VKTVFITIFEGIEAKNLLRSDAVKTILKNPEVRVVFFTKDQGRVEYYQREFSDPRMIYEVVEAPSVKGLDKIFRSLKFQLFRTPTAKLRREMVFEVKKNNLTYYAGSVLNWIFGRRPVVNLVRALDFFLVRKNTYAPFFDKYSPDLVLCANLFDEPETHLLREAKKRNIKTIGLMNSWDKPSARCLLRIIPDKVIVFNDFVKDDLKNYQFVPEGKIYVAGVPQYDSYFSKNFWTREEFFKKINPPAGGDPSKKLIVYAPMGTTYSNSDWDIIDLLHKFSVEENFGKNTEILVRFPPNDFIDKNEIAKRPWLLYDQPGMLFSSKRGIDWDLNFQDLEYLKNTLYHMDLIICYASSISVDAAILDKPVINIDFEIRPAEVMAKSPTQFYKMEHYRKALLSGGIRLVSSPEKLIEWVLSYISNPRSDQEGRQKLVCEQCQFTDGRSGERIGKFILKNLNNEN